MKTVTKAYAEIKLKEKGLRYIEASLLHFLACLLRCNFLQNAFWKVQNSDPFRAVSWDRLHSFSTGVFGDHMWSDFKLLFKEIGRDAEAKIDKQ